MDLRRRLERLERAVEGALGLSGGLTPGEIITCGKWLEQVDAGKVALAAAPPWVQVQVKRVQESRRLHPDGDPALRQLA